MLDNPVILCVEDNALVRRSLKDALESMGYTVNEAADGEEALASVAREKPDTILLDIGLPGRDGYSICKELKSDPRTRLIPVVVVTGMDNRETRLRALSIGANEFLGKPLDMIELKVRVKALVSLKRYTDELEHASVVLKAIAKVLNARDQQTGDHCERVGDIATRIAVALGVDDDGLKNLRLGGLLHDLGKIAIPDNILGKPGKLTAEEYEAIKAHPVVGADLVAPMLSLQGARDLILHHHERLDGSGYPHGLKGDEISLLVRILSVSDIYDVLSTARPYKEALPKDVCLSILREEAQRGWWDERVVETLAELVR